MILPLNLALYTCDLFQGTFNRITEVGGVNGFWRAVTIHCTRLGGRLPASGTVHFFIIRRQSGSWVTY
jgi:hypothetical protein